MRARRQNTPVFPPAFRAPQYGTLFLGQDARLCLRAQPNVQHRVFPLFYESAPDTQAPTSAATKIAIRSQWNHRIKDIISAGPRKAPLRGSGPADGQSAYPLFDEGALPKRNREMNDAQRDEANYDAAGLKQKVD